MTTVSKGQFVTVSSGTVSGYTVLNGGTLYAEQTATVTGSVISGGGSFDIFNSATAISTSLYGYEEVLGASAKASATTVHSGGALYLSSGASSYGTVILNGGGEFISGGDAYHAAIEGGRQAIVGGDTVSATVTNGGVQVVDGGFAGNAAAFDTVLSGMAGGRQSEQYLADGGQSLGTIIRAQAVQDVEQYSSATGTIISSGGAELVYGHATSSVISNGGMEIVSIVGSASSTTVSSGGTLLVLPGAVVTGTTVENGGKVVSTGVAVYHPGASISVYSAVASGVHLTNVNAAEYVMTGGTARGTTITSGIQDVFAGGSASGTIISGGQEIVSSGGSVSGTILRYGATAFIAGSGTTITAGNSGMLDVEKGGGVTGTHVNSGGSEFVGGTASGSVINTGGEERIGAKATETGAKLSGGYLYVEANATDVRTTISSGTLELAHGAHTYSGIVFAGSGGTLMIDGTTMPLATISGFATGDAIAISAIPYSAGVTATVKTKGIVTISSGGSAFNLHIAGATVGETDFAFVSGSELIKTGAGGASASMSFIAGPTSLTNVPEGGTESIASLTMADLVQPTGPSTTQSTPAPAYSAAYAPAPGITAWLNKAPHPPLIFPGSHGI